MAIPLVLVVLVAASDAGDPSTVAMLRAATDSLGPAVRAQLLPSRPPPDAELLDSFAPPKPVAVAEVTWADNQHLRATLHVHIDGAPRWVDRQLGFDPVDSPTERGRALAFALLSMLPERAPLEETTPIAAPPLPPPASTLRSSPPESHPPAELPARPVPETYVPRAAFEVSGVASLGIDGYAGGFGASLAGRWSFTPRFAVRLAGGAREGQIAPASAETQLIFGAIGLVWDAPWRAGPLSFGARVDALLLWHQLSHLDGDDPSPVRQALWQAGADSLIEGSFAFSRSSGLFVAAGGEYAFGQSPVYVAGVHVADVAALRLVSEIGARARF